MKKINFTLTGIITAFLTIAVVVGFVYHTGRQRKPLVFAIIPDVTKIWADGLNKFNTVNISIQDKGPFNWEQEKDLGKRENSGWSSIDTDPNFVIYYKNDALNLNVQNARRVQQIANEAIPEIENLMGRYPYPSTLNGRKLAIYLASTPDEYSNTIDELAGKACKSAGSVGIFISHVGPLGFLPDGIVLSPKCFNYELHPDNWAERVLRHEMNHFVFFSQLSYDKALDHPLWVSEGLADYASLMHREQVSSVDSIEYIANKCELLKEFPTEISSQYWAGRSFYKFMEQEKGPITVREFIQNLYSNPLKTSLETSFTDSTDVKELWVKNLYSQIDSTQVVQANI